MALPDGYVDLATAHRAVDGTFVNLIGSLIDFIPPSFIAKSSQYMQTLKLSDRELSYSSLSEEGLKVRFFISNQNLLPQVTSMGDVVLLRNIKMSSFNNERLALSNWQTEVLVFPCSKIPTLNFSIMYQDKQKLECHGVPAAVNKLNLLEQNYVMNLKQEMNAEIERLNTKRQESAKRATENQAAHHLSERPVKKPRISDANAPKPRCTLGNKFSLIEDLRHGIWADLCAIVAKQSVEEYGCDLYITDYTSNKDVRLNPEPGDDEDHGRDGDTFGYSASSTQKLSDGPYGHMILKVNVKHPHAAKVKSSIRAGDVVLLRNVKVRMATWSGNLFLEGDMWPDHQNQDKVNVIKMMSTEVPEIQALFDRRTQYWDAREARKAPSSENSQQLTKKERKKQRKMEEKERLAREAEAANTLRRGSETNPHVRCTHEDVPITSLGKIIDAENRVHTNPLNDSVVPFVNVRYRARVRVVDFEPKELEDFAVLAEIEDGADESMSWQYDAGTPRYEWNFSLQLEDCSQRNTREKHRIWVQAHHPEAQFLLGNDVGNPDDLRRNEKLLAKLKEKLFILWGDLEEKGVDQDASNTPFDCCIMEYGVEMDEDDPRKETAPFGYERLYAMFGVTIL